MKPFVKETGTVAVLDRVNVDTDQIIPAKYLKRIERSGYGPFLFHSWRFLEDGTPNQNFELNRPEYEGATILVAGKNFGCGSSREHAVWALQGYGFRAIIAPSFAEIFHRNCFQNGVLPISIPGKTCKVIAQRAASSKGYQLTIDLRNERLVDSIELDTTFMVHNDPETNKFYIHCLLNGLDEISLTLEHSDKIARYEESISRQKYA